MPTCTELIAAEPRAHEGRTEARQQPCGLEAEYWCATCRMYICSQHLMNQRIDHTPHTRSSAPLVTPPVNTDAEPHGERRGGLDRRKAR